MSGYNFRAPRPDELPAVVELVRALQVAEYGEADETEEGLGILFRRLDLDRDAWLVEDGDGRVVAGAFVRARHPTRLRSFGGVLPDHTGRGIGSELLRRILARADELAEVDGVGLSQSVAPSNHAAKELLEANGFELVRHFWKMGIDLDADTREPVWPDGIRLETLERGRERDVFDAAEDAFQDHWDHAPHEWDDWRAMMIDRPSFDPSLWVLARDGDAIAGVSLCSLEEDEGWINVLGVRRRWRRRGIARALLLESFRRLRERGKPRAVLGVDSSNPTGATQLYEGAGMHVLLQDDAYRKPLT